MSNDKRPARPPASVWIEPKHPLPPPAEMLATILAQIERRLMRQPSRP
jgi:hypothetical protein